MPINVGILNRRGRERREHPRTPIRIPPLARARARRNFRENYNANSSTLHGYTRNVHRVHSPARRAVTLDQSRRVQLRTFDPPSPRSSPASLSSCRCASVALFAYYWHAACRQQAIEIPSLSIGLCFSLFLPFSSSLPFMLLPSARSSLVSFSLCRSAQREKRRSWYSL